MHRLFKKSALHFSRESEALFATFILCTAITHWHENLNLILSCTFHTNRVSSHKNNAFISYKYLTLMKKSIAEMHICLFHSDLEKLKPFQVRNVKLDRYRNIVWDKLFNTFNRNDSLRLDATSKCCWYVYRCIYLQFRLAIQMNRPGNLIWILIWFFNIK